MEYKEKLINIYRCLIKNGHYRYASNILYLLNNVAVLKLDYKDLYKYIVSLFDYNYLLKNHSGMCINTLFQQYCE